MAVGVVVNVPGMTEAQYRAVRNALGEALQPGNLVHMAGPIEGGWRVVEVWESVEEVGRFLKERFLPALETLGFTGRPPQPQFWPVHTCLTAVARDDRTQPARGRP